MPSPRWRMARSSRLGYEGARRQLAKARRSSRPNSGRSASKVMATRGDAGRLQQARRSCPTRAAQSRSRPRSRALRAAAGDQQAMAARLLNGPCLQRVFSMAIATSWRRRPQRAQLLFAGIGDGRHVGMARQPRDQRRVHSGRSLARRPSAVRKPDAAGSTTPDLKAGLRQRPTRRADKSRSPPHDAAHRRGAIARSGQTMAAPSLRTRRSTPIGPTAKSSDRRPTSIRPTDRLDMVSSPVCGSHASAAPATVRIHSTTAIRRQNTATPPRIAYSLRRRSKTQRKPIYRIVSSLTLLAKTSEYIRSPSSSAIISRILRSPATAAITAPRRARGSRRDRRSTKSSGRPATDQRLAHCSPASPDTKASTSGAARSRPCAEVADAAKRP